MVKNITGMFFIIVFFLMLGIVVYNISMIENRVPYVWLVKE